MANTRKPSEDADDRQIDEWLRQARAGSTEAAQCLIDFCRPYLAIVIRRRLDEARKLRRLYDTDDVVQDAGLAVSAGEIPVEAFDSMGRFHAYLCSVVNNNLSLKVRTHLQTAKSDLGRDVPLEDPKHRIHEEVIAPHPGPDRALERKEIWRKLMDQLSEREQQIVELARLGHSRTEIADRMGVDEKTVRRLIGKLVSSAPPRECVT